MTLQATSPQSKSTFLQRVLQADALFGAMSGLALTFASGPISDFLGLNRPLVLVGLGLGLMAWAVFLFMQAAQETVRPGLVWLVIEANLLWVVASGVILFTNWLPLTTAGWWAVAIVADIVAVFAILQFYGLRKRQA